MKHVCPGQVREVCQTGDGLLPLAGEVAGRTRASCSGADQRINGRRWT